MAHFNKRYPPPGTPPGTLPAPLRMPEFSLTALDYSPTEMREWQLESVAKCRTLLNTPNPIWIHVQGNAGAEAVSELGKLFQLHPLAQEDVLNTGQRPKMEIYDEQVFLVMGVPAFAANAIQVDQFSAFLGRNFLISFHTGETDPFTEVRQRMGVAGNRLRRHGPDYLLYTLVDMVVDRGFPLLESVGDDIQQLEGDVLQQVESGSTMQHIHTLRRDLMLLRRTLWPQRDVVNGLLREESELLKPETRVYLRDCYDHVVQLIDLLESYRDVLTSLLDVYYSGISTRMNDIMRVLTVIATIFIPLTFITGIYGMNFHNPSSPLAMPELRWYWGYPLVMGLMLGIAVGMLYFFYRKRWL